MKPVNVSTVVIGSGIISVVSAIGSIITTALSDDQELKLSRELIIAAAQAGPMISSLLFLLSGVIIVWWAATQAKPLEKLGAVGAQLSQKAKEGAYLDLSFDRALCSPSGVLSAKLQMRSFSPTALVYSRPEIHSLFVLNSRAEGTIEGPSVWHYSPEKDSILSFDLLIDHVQTGNQLISIAVELAVDIDSGNGESKTRKLFGPFPLTAMQTNDEVIYPRKKEVPPDPKA